MVREQHAGVKGHTFRIPGGDERGEATEGVLAWEWDESRTPEDTEVAQDNGRT